MFLQHFRPARWKERTDSAFVYGRAIVEKYGSEKVLAFVGSKGMISRKSVILFEFVNDD